MTPFLVFIAVHSCAAQNGLLVSEFGGKHRSLQLRYKKKSYNCTAQRRLLSVLPRDLDEHVESQNRDKAMCFAFSLRFPLTGRLGRVAKIIQSNLLRLRPHQSPGLYGYGRPADNRNHGMCVCVCVCVCVSVCIHTLYVYMCMYICI